MGFFDRARGKLKVNLKEGTGFIDKAKGKLKVNIHENAKL